MPVPVTDVCALWYDRDCWRFFLHRLARVAPAYFERFGALLAGGFGADAAEYRRVLRERGPDPAIEVLVRFHPADGDPDGHLASLDAQGVVTEVVHGMPGRLPGGETVNERLAALVGRLGPAGAGRVRPWAGITLLDPEAATAEIARCAAAGFTGINVAPFYEGVAPGDPRAAPVFAAAAGHRLPVWVHCGNNFRTDQPMDLCTWRDLDRIAGRHPELVLVAGHAGWPWMLETVAVAQRQPGVYIDLSTHRPRRMSRPGSGFAPLLAYGGTTVRRKVLFGTGGPWVHPVGVPELAAEVRALDLPQGAAEDWLHGNAARLLGEPAAGAAAAAPQTPPHSG
ncbi:amidohydrolase family protein [Streptomyces sp. YIM 98790]|uniref:amidohydrolase family protein n=1 Tax=Streptomyces sp. YIM 98790 TaxID=2689077 RepID=UPI0014089FE1|nr:amidohydrolase family protein [Streptomyces sp. YIM 98790]